jgi:hypothetical protein
MAESDSACRLSIGKHWTSVAHSSNDGIMVAGTFAPDLLVIPSRLVVGARTKCAFSCAAIRSKVCRVWDKEDFLLLALIVYQYPWVWVCIP